MLLLLLLLLFSVKMVTVAFWPGGPLTPGGPCFPTPPEPGHVTLTLTGVPDEVDLCANA